jgi:hypothetical protein
MSGFQGSPPLTTLNFDIEFYKATRAHEVALNIATAAYEQSLLRLILVLNAASIGGFLALWESVKSDSIIGLPSFWISRGAIVIWIVGVGLAFVANWHGYVSQRGFTRAYFNRRRAVEMRRTDSMDPLWPRNLGIDVVGAPEEVISKFNSDAFIYRDKAVESGKRAVLFGTLAASAALIGVLVAIAAIRPQSAVAPGALLTKSVGFEVLARTERVRHLCSREWIEAACHAVLSRHHSARTPELAPTERSGASAGRRWLSACAQRGEETV